MVMPPPPALSEITVTQARDFDHHSCLMSNTHVVVCPANVAQQGLYERGTRRVPSKHLLPSVRSG
jgi:hypothetical protein